MNEFKDCMAFILRQVHSLRYTGQVKHRKATGLSGLKNEKADFETNKARTRRGKSEAREKISARRGLNYIYELLNNELSICKADLK